MKLKSVLSILLLLMLFTTSNTYAEYNGINFTGTEKITFDNQSDFLYFEFDEVSNAKEYVIAVKSNEKKSRKKINSIY
ncbi:MAG: hypothetical protein N4A40_12850 [Tissierellales bacterium]|jgi:hypothetical protein|nr:hypothetical protein [Tissierellales bacterium]